MTAHTYEHKYRLAAQFARLFQDEKRERAENSNATVLPTKTALTHCWNYSARTTGSTFLMTITNNMMQNKLMIFFR
ncbi:hypothetical protein A7P98_00830 [Eikenella sp. NML080894]|uniref:hypothetical protein n=1 Tax=Eikenella TaxID=538 RepID=UPI0007E27E22|nr:MULTISPECIES: hypothetical protein [Eikenella]OAM37727.1 hypothetical protein A7P98_00830 [Eikenella sp. NML080894]OAM38503.1 hypothetical protein A7P99_04970 [Eikenella sp. NML120348]